MTFSGRWYGAGFGALIVPCAVNSLRRWWFHWSLDWMNSVPTGFMSTWNFRVTLLKNRVFAGVIS